MGSLRTLRRKESQEKDITESLTEDIVTSQYIKPGRYYHQVELSEYISYLLSDEWNEELDIPKIKWIT